MNTLKEQLKETKDAILAAAFQEGQYLIWAIAMFTAFLTAFYMFRMYFLLILICY